jgi:hypothetical protein
MTEEKKGCTEIVISDEQLMQINPKGEPLTIETLRSFQGLENITDEEGQEIIFSLQTFCSILLEAVKEQEKLEKENINQLKIAA